MNMNNSKRSVLKSSGATTVAEMVLSLIALPLCLGYITGELKADADATEQRVVLGLVFFILALTRLLRARRFRLAGKTKHAVYIQRIFCAAYLICAVLPLFVGYSQRVGLQDEKSITGGYLGDVRQLIGLVFWISMLIGRIVSMICDHRRRRIVLNVLLSFLIIVFGYILYAGCDLTISMILIVVMSLGSIFGVVFGRVRVDVLKAIIRETYASEILLGLLLLIFAFSYVFKFIEPGIDSFLDGLWYCFAIVTTIGFGDVTAVTIVGRILSVILGMYGIIVVAIITSIVVNFYGETRQKNGQAEDADEPAEQA